MKKKAVQKPGERPFLVEVPKPVNLMTEAELDAFADEILDALEGRGNWKAAQYVNLKQEYEKSFMVSPTAQLTRRSMQLVAAVFHLMIQQLNVLNVGGREIT